MRWSSVVLLGLMWACYARGDQPPQYCATERYVAVAGWSLWVIELGKDNPPAIRERHLRAAPVDIVCTESKVYVHFDREVSAFDLASPDLQVSPGPEWRQIKAGKNRIGGALEPGRMKNLPGSSYRLALARAKLADVADREELLALFFLGPTKTTLIDSHHLATITLE